MMVCGLEEINEELGRISKCQLSVEERPGRGRGLFAQQELDVGQEVLAEQPLAFCLLQEHVSTRCDYTLKAPAGKLLRCSKSKVARYSSREAQAKAWKDYYRSECEALLKLKPHVPGTTARLVARMYWRRERDLLRWNIVSKLENHWPSFSDARKIQLTQMASVVKALLQQKEDAAVDLKDVCMTLARVACNAHTICDDELKPIAVGIYPVASFANHSCEPNCVQVYRGREILYKCLRPVGRGEELTISYVDLCSLESERRDILRKNYFFDIRKEEKESDRKQITKMISSGGGAIEFPIELFTSAGLGGNAATAAPSSLLNEEESRFVSICLKRRSGSEAAGAPEEIGKAFVVTNQDDPSQEQEAKPSSPIHHLGTGGSLSDSMGEEVKVVCSFKFEEEEEEERATKFAKAVGAFLGRTHRVLLQSERLANENQFEEAYSSLKEIHELCNHGVPVNVDCDERLTLGEMHIFRVRVLSLLLHITLQRGSDDDFRTARKAAKQLVQPYKALYGEKSPVYGFHLGMVAKLEAYLGQDLQGVVSLCRESLSVLSAVLPPENSSTAEIERIMNDALVELSSSERREELLY